MFFCVLVFGGQNNKTSTRDEILNYDSFKAIWLSQYDMFGVYTKRGEQRPESEYRSMLTVILDNIKSDGFNTVLVQVRPFGDSICASELYPTSYILTGGYGRESKYDAFKILVDEAHKRALSVHAWINPMRAMRVSEIDKVADVFLIKQWYSDPQKSDRVVALDGRLYLNPYYEDIRSLIVDGVCEILQSYSVDGIHMDDYFYPTTDADFDSRAYSSYRASGGTLRLTDFRRNNLNILVRDIYTAVKRSDTRLLFGVSPGGNYDRTYSEQYADVYTWGSTSGYVDYLCPQIYFGFEHEYFGFEATCHAWENIVSHRSVDLYVGLTFTKAGSAEDAYAGSGSHEWAENDDILARSLLFTRQISKCQGMAVFSYGCLYDPEGGQIKSVTALERANFIPIFRNFFWERE